MPARGASNKRLEKLTRPTTRTSTHSVFIYALARGRPNQMSGYYYAPNGTVQRTVPVVYRQPTYAVERTRCLGNGCADRF